MFEYVRYKMYEKKKKTYQEKKKKWRKKQIEIYPWTFI